MCGNEQAQSSSRGLGQMWASRDSPELACVGVAQNPLTLGLTKIRDLQNLDRVAEVLARYLAEVAVELSRACIGHYVTLHRCSSIGPQQVVSMWWNLDTRDKTDESQSWLRYRSRLFDFDDSW